MSLTPYFKHLMFLAFLELYTPVPLSTQFLYPVDWHRDRSAPRYKYLHENQSFMLEQWNWYCIICIWRQVSVDPKLCVAINMLPAHSEFLLRTCSQRERLEEPCVWSEHHPAFKRRKQQYYLGFHVWGFFHRMYLGAIFFSLHLWSIGRNYCNIIICT